MGFEVIIKKIKFEGPAPEYFIVTLQLDGDTLTACTGDKVEFSGRCVFVENDGTPSTDYILKRGAKITVVTPKGRATLQATPFIQNLTDTPQYKEMEDPK